jgi:hypothetical protein
MDTVKGISSGGGGGSSEGDDGGYSVCSGSGLDLQAKNTKIMIIIKPNFFIALHSITYFVKITG